MNNSDLFGVEFKAIPTSSLLESTVPKFNIYIKHGDDYVLFVKQDNPIDKEIIRHIEENGIDVLYIHRQDTVLYEEYSEQQLESVKKQESELVKQSKILYSSAKHLMKKLFDEKITKESIGTAKKTAQGLLKQITSDKDAFLSLLKVSSHDYYTYTHSINVCIYAVGIGQKLGLDKETLRTLAEASLLHDVGKTEIDEDIINKDGKLTEQEFEAIKRHPTFAREILKANGETDERILDVVEQHHEKLNGEGYPRHLDKAHITKLAQIVTIADIFDALTTERSYKKAMNSFEAFSLMRTRMGNEINMDILKEFIKSFKG